MKVLIADKSEQSGIDGLNAAGCTVIYQPDLELSRQELVVRSTAVTGPMLETGSLSLVVRAGAGYNTIDVATASRRGISDRAPSDALLNAVQDGNSDILDLHLVTI